MCLERGIMKEKNICIALLVHNQYELVMHWLKQYSYYKGQYALVIVDNGSTDDLEKWLRGQQIVDYIICDKSLEKYGTILNVLKNDFARDSDLLVITPNIIILEKEIKIIREKLYSSKATGIVEVGKFDRQLLCIEGKVFMIKNEFLQKNEDFDENMNLPENVLMDYCFKGLEKGYTYREINNLNIVQVSDTVNPYTEKFELSSDRSILKKKWDMNYFNKFPNINLLSYITNDVSEKINVLEIGCDCGVNLLYIKNKYPNASLYGMEINETAGKIASNIAEVHIGNVEVDEIKFKDEIEFDYIIFGDVLEHLRNPQMVLKRCKKVLNKNGKILACIPNLMHWSVMYNLINGDFTYTDMGLLDRTHIHFFTLNEIVKMFDDEGYIIQNMTYTGKEQKENVQVRNFVSKLMDITVNATEDMFFAFQYILSATLR